MWHLILESKLFLLLLWSSWFMDHLDCMCLEPSVLNLNGALTSWTEIWPLGVAFLPDAGSRGKENTVRKQPFLLLGNCQSYFWMTLAWAAFAGVQNKSHECVSLTVRHFCSGLVIMTLLSGSHPCVGGWNREFPAFPHSTRESPLLPSTIFLLIHSSKEGLFMAFRGYLLPNEWDTRWPGVEQLHLTDSLLSSVPRS